MERELHPPDRPVFSAHCQWPMFGVRPRSPTQVSRGWGDTAQTSALKLLSGPPENGCSGMLWDAPSSQVSSFPLGSILGVHVGVEIFLKDQTGIFPFLMKLPWAQDSFCQASLSCNFSLVSHQTEISQQGQALSLHQIFLASLNLRMLSGLSLAKVHLPALLPPFVRTGGHWWNQAALPTSSLSLWQVAPAPVVPTTKLLEMNVPCVMCK